MRGVYIMMVLVVIMSYSAMAQSGTWTRIQPPQVFGNQGVAVEIDRMGRVWVLSSKVAGNNQQFGLDYFDGERWNHVAPGGDFPFEERDRLNDIVADRDQKLWLSGKGAIAWYDSDRWTKASIEDSLASWRTYEALASDSSGNIWVASMVERPVDTLNGGVIVVDIVAELHSFRQGVWQTHFQGRDESQDFYPVGFSSITVSPEGNVWAVAGQNDRRRGGLYMFDGVSWTAIDLQSYGQVSYQRRPTSIMVLPQDKVWIGYDQSVTSSMLYDGGLSCFAPEGWMHYTFGAGLPDDERGIGVLSLYPLDDTTLWVGYRNGLVRFSSSEFDAYIPSDELGVSEWTMVNTIVDIGMERSGRVWLATGGGLIRFDPVTASVTWLDRPASIVASIQPTTITSGNNPRIYLRTDRAGRARLEILDALGRVVVEDLLNVSEGENIFPFQFNSMGCSSGMYFARVILNGDVISIPLRLIR